MILLDGGTVAASEELAHTSEVLIGGPDRQDTSLTVDYAFGPIPIPIDYHPGALGPDTDNLLSIRGASFRNEHHAITGAHSGVIALDDVPITYTNLTPINDTVPSANLIFYAPATAATININTGPVVAGFQTDQINDGGSATFELINFANKAYVTVNGNSIATTFTVNIPVVADGLTTLNINGGTVAGNVFNLQAIPAAITTNVVGAAAATVNVGLGGSTQAISGPVNIENPPALNTIVVDDSSDSTGRVVTLSSFSPNPSDSEGNSDTWGKINGLAPGDINYEYLDTAALTIDGGSGGNVFNVNSTVFGSPGTTTINGGGGADAFNLDASNLGANSVNNFNGQGGDDTFTVTGSLGSGVTLNIDGGGGTNTLSVPAGSTIVPSGPGAGSVSGVVTSYTSIQNGPGPTATPTGTATGTPTDTPTSSPTPTSTPTNTSTRTPTSTPTVTPTSTPTPTPTVTPTPTPLALGDSCTSGTQCASTFCAPGGVCCNAPCTEPNQSCTVPNSVGLCRAQGAPVPATSRAGLIALGVVLAALGVFSLHRALSARR